MLYHAITSEVASNVPFVDQRLSRPSQDLLRFEKLKAKMRWVYALPEPWPVPDFALLRAE